MGPVTRQQQLLAAADRETVRPAVGMAAEEWRSLPVMA